MSRLAIERCKLETATDCLDLSTKLRDAADLGASIGPEGLRVVARALFDAGCLVAISAPADSPSNGAEPSGERRELATRLRAYSRHALPSGLAGLLHEVAAALSESGTGEREAFIAGWFDAQANPEESPDPEHAAEAYESYAAFVGTGAAPETAEPCAFCEETDHLTADCPRHPDERVRERLDSAETAEPVAWAVIPEEGEISVTGDPAKAQSWVENGGAGLTPLYAHPPGEAWIVVNIGCIECGVSSNVVGVFTDEAKAKEVAETLDETHEWREGGQNSFEVFPMPALDEVHPEYRSTKDAAP